MNVVKVKVSVGKTISEVISRGEVWHINLRARAQENKANLELIKLVSKEFKSKKVRIVKGLKSRYKILEIY